METAGQADLGRKYCRRMRNSTPAVGWQLTTVMVGAKMAIAVEKLILSQRYI